MATAETYLLCPGHKIYIIRNVHNRHTIIVIVITCNNAYLLTYICCYYSRVFIKLININYVGVFVIQPDTVCSLSCMLEPEDTLTVTSFARTVFTDQYMHIAFDTTSTRVRNHWNSLQSAIVLAGTLNSFQNLQGKQWRDWKQNTLYKCN